MDKTLLRPLFKKRYMELHKPQKFFQGGIAMAVEQARLRANDNNKKNKLLQNHRVCKKKSLQKKNLFRM